jgi:hypothetical protein
MVRRRVGFGSAVLHQEDHHMHIASIGIDLGKTTFHLVALGERNKVLVRKKFGGGPYIECNWRFIDNHAVVKREAVD